MQSLPFLLVVLWVAVCSGAEGGALEEYVKHAEARFAWQKVEEVNQARFDAGRVAIADLAHSRYYRIQAEIWLERAKEK